MRHKVYAFFLLMPMVLPMEFALSQEHSQSTNTERPVRTLQVKIKASGKPLKGIEVHLSNGDTGHTGADGIAKFSNVPEGEVRVSVPAQETGTGTWKKSGATIKPEETSTEISLEKESGTPRDEDHDRGSGPSH